MKLDRVTITGADDSVHPGAVCELAEQFPFAEWGILFSRSSEGRPRYPTMKWLEDLLSVASAGLKLSAHLCGRWVRDLCLGKPSFLLDRPGVTDSFQRAQINFHASGHATDLDKFAAALKIWDRDEYIIQFDEVNDVLLRELVERGVKAVPLFDTSGGAGIEPTTWPSADPFEYSGYAGGLHPDHILGQLDRIRDAAGDRRIWVDVETHVRSSDDERLDLKKVTAFLSKLAPHVTT